MKFILWLGRLFYLLHVVRSGSVWTDVLKNKKVLDSFKTYGTDLGLMKVEASKDQGDSTVFTRASPPASLKLTFFDRFGLRFARAEYPKGLFNTGEFLVTMICGVKPVVSKIDECASKAKKITAKNVSTGALLLFDVLVDDQSTVEWYERGQHLFGLNRVMGDKSFSSAVLYIDSAESLVKAFKFDCPLMAEVAKLLGVTDAPDCKLEDGLITFKKADQTKLSVDYSGDEPPEEENADADKKEETKEEEKTTEEGENKDGADDTTNKFTFAFETIPKKIVVSTFCKSQKKIVKILAAMKRIGTECKASIDEADKNKLIVELSGDPIDVNTPDKRAIIL